ncbi:hypothetical protein PVAG01_04254 [Phlyctema vagabunda]|uniref:Uncharacterized protein n=1 Tax=Phlyctema vagabunda TaxID=108571 RepID=A0ABR4PP43_9HELO
MSQTPFRLPSGAAQRPPEASVTSKRPSNLRQVALANQASKVASSFPLHEEDDGMETLSSTFSSLMPPLDENEKTQSSSGAMPSQSKIHSTSKMPSRMPSSQSKLPDISKAPASAMPTPSKFRDATKASSMMPTPSKFRDTSLEPGSMMPTPSKFRDVTTVPRSVMPTPSNFRDVTRVQASVFPGESILEGEEDERMALRQSRFPTLTPKQQVEQEEWAQMKLELGGSCYDGAKWVRTDEDCGYMCSAGRHWVDDELLSEGKGGWYLLKKKHDLSTKSKKFYGNPMAEPWAINSRGEPFKIVESKIVML